MNSGAWQAELHSAQKHILEQKGSQGGGLRKILRHLSYAPQRPGRFCHHAFLGLCVDRATICPSEIEGPGVNEQAQ